MKNKTQIFSTVKVIILAFVLAVGLQYAAAQSWSAPTGSPPANNTYAPLNVGTSGQIKDGGLTVGYSDSTTNGLLVKYGRVGIGTTAPSAEAKMTVANDTSAENTRFDSGLASSFIRVKSGSGSNLLGVEANGAWIGPTAGLPLIFKVNDAQVGKFSNTTGNLELTNQIKIAGGTPADGKVLTATDSSGNATWENPGAPTAPTTVMAEYSTPDQSHSPAWVFPQGYSNRVATCPSGKTLVSCTGGMVREGVGDADDNEASLIVPNTSNNSCTIYYEPDTGDAITVRVYAFCM